MKQTILRIKIRAFSIRVLVVLLTLFLLFLTTLLLVHMLSTPHNDREWTVDQKILPTVAFENNMVTIQNIRNFEYVDEFTYTPHYYNKTYNLNELTSVDFILVPLAKHAVAHTFLSFGFKNGTYVAISIEVRKEKGEEFSALKGLFDQYEIMYVVADERDVLRLRGIYRDNQVYLYPAEISQEKMQELFVSMLTRVQSLSQTPEFYNTLTSSCTTNIVAHVNEVSDKKVPFDPRVFLPLKADELAYELGFINTSIPFPELREQSEIHGLIKKYGDDQNFSTKIRKKDK